MVGGATKKIGITVFFIAFLVGALMLRGCSAPVTHGFRIARDVSWYPLNLVGRERAVLAFSDDLIVSIADDYGFHVDLDSQGPEHLLERLNQGLYDGILVTYPPDPRKGRVFLFSDPYFYTGPVLIVHEESRAQNLKDMKDRRVGILTGNIVVFPADHYPSIVLRSYGSVIQALESLLRYEIDGLILDLIPAYTYLAGLYRGSLKVVGPPLTDDGLRLVVRRDRSPELVEMFNKGLGEMRADGSYHALLEKWNLTNPVENREETTEDQ